MTFGRSPTIPPPEQEPRMSHPYSSESSQLRQGEAPPGESWVWQAYALGGGRWVPQPLVPRLSDEDVERIARAVVRLLKAERITP